MSADAPLRGILWMVGAALCFSVALVLVRHLSASFSTFEIVFLRQLFGLAVMLPWLARYRMAGLRTQRLHIHALRAVLGYVAMLASYYAVTQIIIADAMALQFTLPLFTTLLALAILGEKVDRVRWAATAVGFAGALLIIRPGFAAVNIGMPLMLIATALYAGSDTAARYLSRTDSTNTILFYGFALHVPLASLPAVFAWTTPGWTDLPAILVFAVASFGAQFCLVRAFSMADASLVSPILYVRLPFVAAIGYIAYGEAVDLWTWIGAGVIFSATTISTRHATRAHSAILNSRQ